MIGYNWLQLPTIGYDWLRLVLTIGYDWLRLVTMFSASHKNAFKTF